MLNSVFKCSETEFIVCTMELNFTFHHHICFLRMNCDKPVVSGGENWSTLGHLPTNLTVNFLTNIIGFKFMKWTRFVCI